MGSRRYRCDGRSIGVLDLPDGCTRSGASYELREKAAAARCRWSGMAGDFHLNMGLQINKDLLPAQGIRQVLCCGVERYLYILTNNIFLLCKYYVHSFCYNGQQLLIERSTYH